MPLATSLSPMNFIVVSVFFLYMIYAIMACPEKCSCDSKTKSYLVKCYSAQLTKLPKDMSNNVTILLMPFNVIRQLSNRTFSNYRNLEHIVISHNRIEKVSPGAFSGLSNLVRLVLSGNLIVHYPWSSLSDTPAMSVLSLDDNKIKNLPDKTELERLKRLKSFRIHGNNLICSCEIFLFAEWIQENEKRSGRSEKDVTILKTEQITCQSRLGWLNINVMEIDVVGSKMQCLLPNLHMKATTSLNDSTNDAVQQAPLRNVNVTEKLHAPLRNVNVTLISQHSDDSGKRLTNALQSNQTKIKNEAIITSALSQKFTASGDLNYTLKYHSVISDAGNLTKEVFHVYARESSPLRITCNIENYSELPPTSDIFLRTSVLLAGDRYVDIEQLANWTNRNDVVIEKLEWTIHNSMQVVCASENIAGTVSRQVRIHVAREEQESKPEIGEINITVPNKNMEEEDSRTVDDTGRDEAEIVNENASPADSEYASLCLDNPISPLIRLNGTNSTRGLKYRYSYAGRINVTIREDWQERGIAVTINSDQPDMGMIYICHSHADRVVRKWKKLRETEERIVIRSSSAVRPFIVCVMSTYFQREVCGNFTSSGRVTHSIIVMAVVGTFLIGMAVVPMVLAALHHVYTGRQQRFPNLRREMRIRELPPPMGDYWAADAARSKKIEQRREIKQSRTTPTMKKIILRPQVRSMECLRLPQDDYNLEDRQYLLGNSSGPGSSTRQTGESSNAYLNTEDPVVKWLQNVDTEEYQYDEGVGHLL